MDNLTSDADPAGPETSKNPCPDTSFGEAEDVPNKASDVEQLVSVVESATSAIYDATSFLETSIEEDTQYVSQMETTAEEDTQYETQIESMVEEESEIVIKLDDTAVIETSAVDPGDNCNMQPEKENNSISKGYEIVDESNFFKCKVFELGRYLWKTNPNKQCYTKGCLWSPDGTCCLVPVHLDGMHLVELPSDLYQENMPSERPVTKFTSAVHVKEGGTVYDFAWYPFMNSTAPETCCWLASRQHEPIQMWDAFNGDLRATYRGYDDVDEIEAAISVAFSCDGLQVLGGYKKYIRIFNTDIPGRSSTKLVTKQAISCFALSSNNSDIITTGSWNGVINLYDQRVANIGSLSGLFGHTGGITFLKYSNSGDILFSGARKDNGLCLWDMRNFSEPLVTLKRCVSTNQRIYFDLSPQNEWLISGDTTGLVRIWNLKDFETKRTFRLHGDSCNGVSFHPTKPIIASSAGQYHFIDPLDVNAEEETVIEYENSLIFWWIKPRDCEETNV